MNLIPNWKQGWRLTSAQAAAALVAINLLQVQVLPALDFAIPEAVLPYVNAVLAILVIVCRLVAQPSAAQPPKEAP